MRMAFRPSGRAWWSYRPKEPGEFLSPFAFYSIQAFAQAVKDSATTDLGLTITLRIVGFGEPVGDLILRAKVDHLLAGKVCPIVKDIGVGEFEATHDVLPKKLDNMVTSDFREWHRFDPFGELVDGYQQEPQLRLSSRECINYGQPLLHKGPRTLQSVKADTRSF